MPRLSRGASKEAKQECADREMGRFKRGTLHSGKDGKTVTNRQHAQAIMMSVCGMSRKGKKSGRKTSRGGRR